MSTDPLSSSVYQNRDSSTTFDVPGAARNEPRGIPYNTIPWFLKEKGRPETTISPCEQIDDSAEIRHIGNSPEVIPAPLPVFPARTSQLLQQWEGTVIKVDDESIMVKLIDLIDIKHPEENASISLAEVAPSDLPLVQPGAVFYLSISYICEPSGQKLLSSEIRFRRLPSWTKREIENVKINALKFRKTFGQNGISEARQ